MPRQPDVDQWFADYDNPMKEVVQAVRDAILAVDPRMDECIKWKAPTFTFAGNLASFFPKSKKHASLMFHQGAKIPGNHPRLEGGGDTSRMMKFGSVQDVAAAREELAAVVNAWIAWRCEPAPKKATTKKKAAKKKSASATRAGKKATKKKGSSTSGGKKKASATPVKKKAGKKKVAKKKVAKKKTAKKTKRAAGAGKKAASQKAGPIGASKKRGSATRSAKKSANKKVAKGSSGTGVSTRAASKKGSAKKRSTGPGRTRARR